MSVEHKNLTGSELHEPKGADTASAGQVYVANGSGSGTWQGKTSDILNLNTFILAQKMEDISAVDDSVYFYIPFKSKMLNLSAVLHGPISTANDVLQIFINGTLFADSLSVNYAGSAAGSSFNTNITTANTINPGSVIRVKSNGASDTTARATITLVLQAIT